MQELIMSYVNQAKAKYEDYTHATILDYETSRIIGAELGWNATESKSILLKSKKDEQYYIFVTTEDVRVDNKKLKQMLGKKVSLCSRDEVIDKTGCLPGCVPPFGYSKDYSLIIDEEIFNHKQLIFSPAVSNRTIIIDVPDIKKVLNILPNDIMYFNASMDYSVQVSCCFGYSNLELYYISSMVQNWDKHIKVKAWQCQAFFSAKININRIK